MDSAKRQDTKAILKRVFDFEAYRNRKWRIIFFRSEDDQDENEFFNWSEAMSHKMPAKNGEEQKPWFQGIIYVYYERSMLKSIFSGKVRASATYKDLNTYLKEYNDPRLV